MLQVAEHAVVEPGADLARVHELTVLEKANEKRADRPPAVRRQREAADHHLLAQPALGLPPVPAAARAIGTIGALAHDTLEPGFPRLLEELGPLAAHVVAEAQGGGRRFEEAPQHLLAFLEPHLPEVPAVEVEEVESEIDERRPCVGTALESLEARRPVGQHRRHLAVEECRARGQTAEGAGDLRELLRPVLPVAGNEPHVPLVDPGDDAIAVVLDLVEPLVAVGRGLHDHRQRQGLGPGQRPADGAFEVREAETRTAVSLGGPPGIHLASGADHLRVPETVPLGRHLGEAASAEDALRTRAHDVQLRRRPRALVLVLDEEPRLGVVPLDLDERPLAGELLALELELQLPLLQREGRLDDGSPPPAVPEHDGTRPVLALRDHTLEGPVFDRVVLDAHREPLVARVEGRALRHGPAQQDPVQLQAEVVVEPRRRVLLDAVRRPAGGAGLTRGLGRPGEVALLLVVFESHPEIAYATGSTPVESCFNKEGPPRHGQQRLDRDPVARLELRGPHAGAEKRMTQGAESPYRQKECKAVTSIQVNKPM